MSIVLINDPEGAPPNIPYVELDDATVASDSALVSDSYIPDEPDPEHLCQSKETWEYQSGHLCRTDKATVLFGPNRLQFAPPDSFLRNSKANNAIIFRK